MARIVGLLFISVGFVFAGTASAQIVEPVQANEDLIITSKPKPGYTDAARRKHIQGTVILNVEFLASGEIGAIIDITKKRREKFQKYGLTDMAIVAARKIKFIPAKENGVPVTTIKKAEYTFSIY